MGKKCFKCGIEKELSDFYVHPRMLDGHLNKCKDCTRKDVKERYDRLMLDKDWHQKEKDRGCDKYHRLNYVKRHKSTPEKKKAIIQKYYEKYPEKEAARNQCSNIHAPEGMTKHHWSYRKEHIKDVIFLTPIKHAKIHRYIIYDQSLMMYCTDDGSVLDTKEAHEKFILSI